MEFEDFWEDYGWNQSGISMESAKQIWIVAQREQREKDYLLMGDALKEARKEITQQIAKLQQLSVDLF